MTKSLVVGGGIRKRLQTKLFQATEDYLNWQENLPTNNLNSTNFAIKNVSRKNVGQMCKSSIKFSKVKHNSFILVYRWVQKARWFGYSLSIWRICTE